MKNKRTMPMILLTIGLLCFAVAGAMLLSDSPNRLIKTKGHPEGITFEEREIKAERINAQMTIILEMLEDVNTDISPETIKWAQEKNDSLAKENNKLVRIGQ